MSEWMSGWALAAWLMLGGSTVLLFIGMPVALTFITINILGAWPDAVDTQQCVVSHGVFAHADSAICVDG